MNLIGFAPSPCFPHHQPSNSHSHCVSQRRGPGPPAGCHLRRGHVGSLQNPIFFVGKKRPKTSFPLFKPQKQVGSRRHRYVYSVLHNLLTCFKYIAKHVITSLFSWFYCYMAPHGPPMAPHGMKSLLWLSPPLLRSLTYQTKPQALNPPPAREC